MANLMPVPDLHTTPHRRTHLLVSAAIVGAVLLQAAAFVTPADRQLYPFLDYPMYRRAFGAPVQAVEWQLFAQLDDGAEVEVTPNYMALEFFAWRDLHVARIVKLEEGDARRVEAEQRVVRAVERREGTEVSALRIVSAIVRLEGGDFVDVTEEMLVPVAGSASAGSGR